MARVNGMALIIKTQSDHVRPKRRSGFVGLIDHPSTRSQRILPPEVNLFYRSKKTGKLRD